MNIRQFGFTCDTDITDLKKFEGITELRNILNNKLNISDFTNKIEKIVFVYLAVNIENFTKTENFIKFRTKSKTIELGVNLPYNQFITADKQTEFDLLKNAYIEGIETLLSKRKDIDWKKLLADFKNLFENDLVIN